MSDPAGFRVVDEVTLVDAGSARVYEHGWQSWSPTGSYPSVGTSPRPRTPAHRLMRFRPGSPPPARGFQGEGLLAVDPGGGDRVRVYAAPVDPASLHRVPSIRARAEGSRIVVSASEPLADPVFAASVPAGLAGLADGFAAAAGVGVLRPAPTVWCSWYHYFLDVTQADVEENLRALTERDLPVDVVQVDDGWEVAVGDWDRLSAGFTSLSSLAEAIRASGRRAGIWVAPFVVAESSAVAAAHPDWMMGPAGHNWGQSFFGLDLTHPGVREHLWRIFRRLREVGFDYFKLDFLYGGALPGDRVVDTPALAAYRSGLELIRSAVGSASYLLGCGAPILPSIGLVDAMRVSPDTYNPADPADGGDATAPLRGERSSRTRAWQHGRWWVNDADCLVARPAFAHRARWAGVVERYGGLRSFSDRVTDLDDWGLETVRRLLTAVPAPEPFLLPTEAVSS